MMAPPGRATKKKNPYQSAAHGPLHGPPTHPSPYGGLPHAPGHFFLGELGCRWWRTFLCEYVSRRWLMMQTDETIAAFANVISPPDAVLDLPEPHTLTYVATAGLHRLGFRPTKGDSTPCTVHSITLSFRQDEEVTMRQIQNTFAGTEMEAHVDHILQSVQRQWSDELNGRERRAEEAVEQEPEKEMKKTVPKPGGMMSRGIKRRLSFENNTSRLIDNMQYETFMARSVKEPAEEPMAEVQQQPDEQPMEEEGEAQPQAVASAATEPPTLARRLLEKFRQFHSNLEPKEANEVDTFFGKLAGQSSEPVEVPEVPEVLMEFVVTLPPELLNFTQTWTSGSLQKDEFQQHGTAQMAESDTAATRTPAAAALAMSGGVAATTFYIGPEVLEKRMWDLLTIMYSISNILKSYISKLRNQVVLAELHLQRGNEQQNVKLQHLLEQCRDVARTESTDRREHFAFLEVLFSRPDGMSSEEFGLDVHQNPQKYIHQWRQTVVDQAFQRAQQALQGESLTEWDKVARKTLGLLEQEVDASGECMLKMTTRPVTGTAIYVSNTLSYVIKRAWNFGTKPQVEEETKPGVEDTEGGWMKWVWSMITGVRSDSWKDIFTGLVDSAYRYSLNAIVASEATHRSLSYLCTSTQQALALKDVYDGNLLTASAKAFLPDPVQAISAGLNLPTFQLLSYAAAAVATLGARRCFRNNNSALVHKCVVGAIAVMHGIGRALGSFEFRGMYHAVSHNTSEMATLISVLVILFSFLSVAVDRGEQLVSLLTRWKKDKERTLTQAERLQIASALGSMQEAFREKYPNTKSILHDYKPQ